MLMSTDCSQFPGESDREELGKRALIEYELKLQRLFEFCFRFPIPVFVSLRHSDLANKCGMANGLVTFTDKI